MRIALASAAFLILAASSFPAASQSTGDPAMPSNTSAASKVTATTSSTVSANALTKAKAKQHMRDAGYRNVRALLKGSDGVWHAKATKGGQPVDVALDLMGKITTS